MRMHTMQVNPAPLGPSLDVPLEDSRYKIPENDRWLPERIEQIKQANQWFEDVSSRPDVLNSVQVRVEATMAGLKENPAAIQFGLVRDSELNSESAIKSQIHYLKEMSSKRLHIAGLNADESGGNVGVDEPRSVITEKLRTFEAKPEPERLDDVISHLINTQLVAELDNLITSAQSRLLDIQNAPAPDLENPSELGSPPDTDLGNATDPVPEAVELPASEQIDNLELTPEEPNHDSTVGVENATASAPLDPTTKDDIQVRYDAAHQWRQDKINDPHIQELAEKLSKTPDMDYLDNHLQQSFDRPIEAMKYQQSLIDNKADRIGLSTGNTGYVLHEFEALNDYERTQKVIEELALRHASARFTPEIARLENEAEALARGPAIDELTTLAPPSPPLTPNTADLSGSPATNKFKPVSASSFLKNKAAPKAALTQEELDQQEIERQRALQQGQQMQQGGGKTNLFAGLMSSLFGGGSRGYDKAMDNPVQKASMQRENQHELLIQSMTHSANKVAAMSAALETGDLAPVLKKMKEQGVSLQELTQNSDHKELRDEYVEAMAPHQRKLQQEMDQLAFYSDAAAKSAVEQGENIEPQIADMFDNVGEATKNIATEDGEGKLKELSESMAEMMAKVQDAVRNLFSKFSPNQ